MSLLMAPITKLVFDLLGVTPAVGVVLILVLAGVYLWATRTGRHK